MSLDGKNAVVTGAARGIGAAIAKVLAARGAAVAVWDLNEDGAEETAAAIRAEGGKAIAVAGDASLASDVAAATLRTRSELGPITILVNNAGISGFAPFVSMTEEAWDRMIGVNLKSAFLVTREIAPDMLAAAWGRIINISSSSAQGGSPAMAHYAASKGGIIGLTKALAMEFIDKGITVNNVPPGMVDTPLARETLSDLDAVAKAMPMKRAGVPDDIAYAVAYLASEEASYVTGQTLSVNGGRYLF